MSKENSKKLEQKTDKNQTKEEVQSKSTNPFEGRRRQAHNAWMKVVAEGSLTPEPID